MPQTELGHKHLRHPREGLQACDRASTRPCPSTSGSTAARLPSPSVPTHSSAPRLPAAPTRVIPIHYSSITPTASSSCCCNGGDLVRVTAKGRNPLILTRRCHASFSTLPRDGEDKHLPAESPKAACDGGKRDGNIIIWIPLPRQSHSAPLRSRVRPSAFISRQRSCPTAVPPPHPAGGERRARCSHTKELRAADPPLRPPPLPPPSLASSPPKQTSAFHKGWKKNPQNNPP